MDELPPDTPETDNDEELSDAKRMKKIKLSMKDKITFIENQITPDIIA